MSGAPVVSESSAGPAGIGACAPNISTSTPRPARSRSATSATSRFSASAARAAGRRCASASGDDRPSRAPRRWRDEQLVEPARLELLGHGERPGARARSSSGRRRPSCPCAGARRSRPSPPRRPRRDARTPCRSRPARRSPRRLSSGGGTRRPSTARSSSNASRVDATHERIVDRRARAPAPGSRRPSRARPGQPIRRAGRALREQPARLLGQRARAARERLVGQQNARCAQRLLLGSTGRDRLVRRRVTPAPPSRPGSSARATASIETPHAAHDGPAEPAEREARDDQRVADPARHVALLDGVAERRAARADVRREEARAERDERAAATCGLERRGPPTRSAPGPAPSRAGRAARRASGRAASPAPWFARWPPISRSTADDAGARRRRRAARRARMSARRPPPPAPPRHERRAGWPSCADARGRGSAIGIRREPSTCLESPGPRPGRSPC